jgi:hypothetical protein
MRLSGSALQFRDGATVYTELNAGDLTIGNTSQDHIKITSSAIQIKDSTVVRGEWQTDGDIFIGSNISSAANTYLSIFAQAQTYNSESMSAGDMLIGDNSSNKANIFWDKSAAQLEFRGGTSTQAYIDTDGTLVAGGGDVTLDSTGISLVSGTGNSNKYKIQDSSNSIMEIYSAVDGGESQSEFVSIGKNSSNHEAMFFIQAITDDGSAHAGAASVNLIGSTEQDRVDFTAEIVSFSESIRLIGMTTAQRNALTGPVAGMMVYNTTDSKFQGYDGGSWNNFH